MRTNSADAPCETLADMAVFARVVEAGSFSAAARALGVTPSAVSRQIGRLEAALQVRLLERSTRKLRLTEVGAAVERRCRDIVEAAQSVRAISASHVETPRGLLRVSLPKAFGRFVVHPLMPAFLARHPDVDVQLVVDDRARDLFDDGLDLALRITEAPPPGLVGRPLLRVNHLVCASPDYLMRHGVPLHPRDLSAHSCLYLGEDANDRAWRFRRGAEECTVRVSGRYVANHSEMRMEGALQHLGVATLPDFTARAALATGHLIALLPEWQHITRYAGTVWVLYPAGRFLAPKQRVFIDYLVEHLQVRG